MISAKSSLKNLGTPIECQIFPNQVSLTGPGGNLANGSTYRGLRAARPSAPRDAGGCDTTNGTVPLAVPLRAAVNAMAAMAGIHGFRWIGLRENLNRKPWFLPTNWLGFPVNFPIIQFYDNMAMAEW